MAYFGARFFAPRYFGGRYWSTEAGELIVAQQPRITLGGPINGPPPRRRATIVNAVARGKKLVATTLLIRGTAKGTAKIKGRLIVDERRCSMLLGAAFYSVDATAQGKAIQVLGLIAEHGEAKGFDAVQYDNNFILTLAA